MGFSSESSALSGQGDVSLNNPTTGQGLVYNATTNKWVNVTLPSGTYTKPPSGIPATDINIASVISDDSMNLALYGLRITTPRTPTSDTSYLPAAGWQGFVYEIDSASNVTVYLPSDTSSVYAIGQMIHCRQLGTGTVTFAADTGVTLQTADSLTLRKQFSSAIAHKRASNTWFIEGDLA